MPYSNTTDDFKRELDCSYKDEHYSARDNGAVLRHVRDGKRPRQADNQWTFGKLNEKTGYLEIAAVRVHSIVATAFHGVPPTKYHVVDHIDTNNFNNRPENLRWVTRLENALLNPTVAKRIVFSCGSIESFLANPSEFRDQFQEPNFAWLCAVSQEEAQTSLERLLSWAGTDLQSYGGTLDQWIFYRTFLPEQPVEEISEVAAITVNAIQRNWKIPSEFPCCPQLHTKDPIATYSENLKIGVLFCRNDLYSSVVFKSALSGDRQSLFVLSQSTEGKSAIKPWALAQITYENDFFVHTSLGTFFEEKGGEKQFCIVQGLEWSGGDSIDDYC